MSEKPLFISFSSGRTSAFMARYLQLRYPIRPKVFIFANTGKEQEESLQFANECDLAWGLNLVWVEAVVNPEKGKPTTHRVVSFATAARNNAVRRDPTTPFEEVIKKYGIPNITRPHCTRELKLHPMHHYVKKVLKWKDYETAIGYRTDEKKQRATYQKGQVYPLIDEIQVDKLFIREWWSRQPFDLKLKDYEGNCDLCWKKSVRKKMTLIRENPDMPDWWMEMEQKYATSVGGVPMNFHRENKSTLDLVKKSKRPFRMVMDEYQKHVAARPMFDPSLDEELHCLCSAS